MYRSVILGLLLCGNVIAHDMTPTYPKWKMSFIPSAKMTTMKVFNKRSDVQWYQIGVFDKEWNPVRFASESKIIPINYKERKYITIYLSGNGIKNAKYICSKSKILLTVKKPSIVSSRICSKLK